MAITIKGTVPEERMLTFIKFFSERHPVDRDVVFEFEDKEHLKLRGMKCNGIVSTFDNAPARIRIAARAHENNKIMGARWRLATLAHEYRHVLQRHRDGVTFENRWDRELEMDAMDFANSELDAALEAGIINVT